MCGRDLDFVSVRTTLYTRKTKMTPSRFLKAAVVSLASVCVAAVPARGEGEKHDFKPKFTKDSVIKYVMTMSVSGTMKRGEEERKGVSMQTLHVSRKVVSTSETSAKVEVTIGHVVAEATPPMGGELMKFDSKQPVEQDAGNMLAMKYRQMVDKPYVFDVALDGTITDVELPKDALVGDSKDELKNTFAPLFRLRAGEPVIAVGESWETTEFVPGSNQNLTTKSKSTLSEVKDGTAKVTVEGKVAFKEGATPPGMEFKEASEGGHVVWSLTDGALVERTSVQKLALSNAEMALDVNSTTESTIKRED